MVPGGPPPGTSASGDLLAVRRRNVGAIAVTSGEAGRMRLETVKSGLATVDTHDVPAQ